MKSRYCVLSVAAFLTAADAKPPPEPSRPASIEQSGGTHEGDNVIGDQTKVIIHGNTTIVLPGAASAPAGEQRQKAAKPAPERSRDVQVAGFITNGCIIGPAAMRSQMFADLTFDFGMPIADFARIPADEPPVYRKFTGTRPIVTPRILESVSPERLDNELGCVEFVKDDCIEYDLYSIEDGRSLTRRWATEWEDQERKGLLKDPDRLAQIVGCFSEDDNTLANNGAQLWTIRLESLAGLLEQPQTAAEIGAARRHSLLADVLQRWAHLLIVRATQEPIEDVHLKAGDLFAKAADLLPATEWLSKAAADQYAKHRAYDRAADQQERLIGVIRAEAADQSTWHIRQRREAFAMLQLIAWRGAAGQLNLAQRASSDLRQRLDSADRMELADRLRFQVMAHIMTGEIFAERQQWDTASEYYEAAADYAAQSGDPPLAGVEGLYSWGRGEKQPWLLHAGVLASFGENRVRMTTLDRRIRATVPYFLKDTALPTWDVWRYLMARWWSTLGLKDRYQYESARLEADLALEQLLQRPVAIDSDDVAALDGLNAGESLANGVFPAAAFLQSNSETEGAATALLYRSTIEYLARARQYASDKLIDEALNSYATATDFAAELTKRIPQSGPFLEIAVLRAEVCFLQEHQLVPLRALQLTKRADSLRVAASCNERIRGAYRANAQQLRSNEKSLEKETILGSVPLMCPFAEI